jgi:glycosyltransferase involved in cell wall biosynthesis
MARDVSVRTRELRVLMLLQNCPFPRDDRVRRETRTLIGAGYQVAVIAPRGPGQPGAEVVEGVRVFRFLAPRPGQGFLGYLWEYGYSLLVMFFASLRVLIDQGFDVVHGHHPPDALVFIGAFYRLLGKPYVLDHHDLSPELYHARFGGLGHRVIPWVLVLVERLALRVANHVVTTNESYKVVELRRGGVPEHKITIVRNGPDLDELRCEDEAIRSNRKSHFVFGYVGVMAPQDGVDNLLRAVHHLVCRFGETAFRCLLVGTGSALPELRSLSNKLGIASRVEFTGWVGQQSEIARLLNSMDICVAPEPSDPYNDRSTAAKIMEYMALGKPVVAFDLPEHRVTAQDAAIYAHPNDTVDLARKMAFLMANPEECARRGRVGTERILSRLAWSHQAGMLLKVYEAISAAVWTVR